VIVFHLIPFIINDSFVFLNISITKITVIALFLAVGAIGKSAQIGLHT